MLGLDRRGEGADEFEIDESGGSAGAEENWWCGWPGVVRVFDVDGVEVTVEDEVEVEEGKEPGCFRCGGKKLSEFLGAAFLSIRAFVGLSSAAAYDVPARWWNAVGSAASLLTRFGGFQTADDDDSKPSSPGSVAVSSSLPGAFLVRFEGFVGLYDAGLAETTVTALCLDAAEEDV